MAPALRVLHTRPVRIPLYALSTVKVQHPFDSPAAALIFVDSFLPASCILETHSHPPFRKTMNQRLPASSSHARRLPGRRPRVCAQVTLRAPPELAPFRDVFLRLFQRNLAATDGDTPAARLGRETSIQELLTPERTMAFTYAYAGARLTESAQRPPFRDEDAVPPAPGRGR
jgi:hypothetical protein